MQLKKNPEGFERDINPKQKNLCKHTDQDKEGAEAEEFGKDVQKKSEIDEVKTLETKGKHFYREFLLKSCQQSSLLHFLT